MHFYKSNRLFQHLVWIVSLLLAKFPSTHSIVPRVHQVIPRRASTCLRGRLPLICPETIGPELEFDGIIIIKKAFHGFNAIPQSCQPDNSGCTREVNLFNLHQLCTGRQECTLNAPPEAAYIKHCRKDSNYVTVEYDCISRHNLINICSYSLQPVIRKVAFIITPTYPEPYKPNLDCRCDVHAMPPRGQVERAKLRTKVLDMKLEGNHRGIKCPNDWLEMVNGDTKHPPTEPPTKYCGSNNRRGIHTHDLRINDSMTLTFHTNPTVHRKGFLIEFKADPANSLLSITCGHASPIGLGVVPPTRPPTPAPVIQTTRPYQPPQMPIEPLPSEHRNVNDTVGATEILELPTTGQHEEIQRGPPESPARRPTRPLNAAPWVPPSGGTGVERGTLSGFFNVLHSPGKPDENRQDSKGTRDDRDKVSDSHDGMDDNFFSRIKHDTVALAIIGAALGAIIMILIALALLVIWHRRKTNRKHRALSRQLSMISRISHTSRMSRSSSLASFCSSANSPGRTFSQDPALVDYSPNVTEGSMVCPPMALQRPAYDPNVGNFGSMMAAGGSTYNYSGSYIDIIDDDGYGSYSQRSRPTGEYESMHYFGGKIAQGAKLASPSEIKDKHKSKKHRSHGKTAGERPLPPIPAQEDYNRSDDDKCMTSDNSSYDLDKANCYELAEGQGYVYPTTGSVLSTFKPRTESTNTDEGSQYNGAVAATDTQFLPPPFPDDSTPPPPPYPESEHSDNSTGSEGLPPAPDFPGDDFMSMLERIQSRRLDDQRALLPDIPPPAEYSDPISDVDTEETVINDNPHRPLERMNAANVSGEVNDTTQC